MLQLTNTLTRKKENFKPLKEEKVKVYYCGPTPYNYAHIGNLRAYLFSDMIVRTLRFLGYKVETTMNITDIDDKTIKDSITKNIPLLEITQKFSKIFLEDLTRLGIKHADNIAPISGLIPEMVEIINGLLSKGYAYLAEDGSIYFSIAKFKNYGELAHLDKKGLISSVRINNDEYEKEEVADFALWKAYDEKKDGPNKWEGNFKIITNNQDGKDTKNLKTKDYNLKTIWGRPGWHIECSACNMKYFGPQIDIHMGAIDNIFPHHQNEIAQTEAYTGKLFSKYWMHNGHLMVNNRKMAKRDGTFLILNDIVNELKDEATEKIILRGYRFLSYGSKYADSFNFTYDRLRQSITNIRSFDELFKRIKNYQAKAGKFSKQVSEDLQYFIQEYIARFEDDFDSVGALAVLFEFIKYVNSGISSNLFTNQEIEAIINIFKTYNEILNIFDFSILEIQEEIPEEIQKLLQDRQEAKLSKDFKLSDDLRDIITSKGYKIIDDKNGSRVEKI